MLALPWRSNEKIYVKGEALKLEEGLESDADDTCGSILWDACVVLMNHLEKNLKKEDLVLELGCGVGALSIGISKLSVCERVIATGRNVGFCLGYFVCSFMVKLMLGSVVVW
jgi:Lysine methyltransferase